MSDPGFTTPFLMRGDPDFEDEERRLEAYRKVFSTVDGRMVLADILVRGGCGTPAWSPAPDGPDGRPLYRRPTADAIFNSGIHAFALSIASDAGLNTGLLGRALVSGILETMKEPHDD